MITYTVKYKKFGGLFWKSIKKVKGDFIAHDVPEQPRVLILEDESRIEIPAKGTMFWFSKDRFIAIKQRMEQEAGQPLPIHPS